MHKGLGEKVFSFYGSKSKIVKKYPLPKHQTIIEPFAGSARYSLEHWEHDVILYDIDRNIVETWEWLIREAVPDDILALPLLKPGEVIPDIHPKGAKNFLSFMSNQGSATPKNITGRMNFCRWNPSKIASSLYKIKHWKIVFGSYQDCPDLEATWFVDPPYQEKGKWYKHNKIDYVELEGFVRQRKGQVIVCEQDGATWMPFRQLTCVAGQMYKTKEVIWTS